MSSIDLNKYNIRLFKCKMILQDYLWFASYDISSVSTTEAVIHNYALSYAVSRYDRGLMNNRGPTYDRDLSNMDFYALSARPVEYKKVSLTYNALDNKTLTTDEFDRVKKNTPKLGKKNMITPLSTFEFYLFSRGVTPTGLIRLGKKRSLARIQWQEIKEPVAAFEEECFTVDHIINPLDVVGDLKRYKTIRIPPFLLLEDVSIEKDWLIKDNKFIHLPKRIQNLVI